MGTNDCLIRMAQSADLDAVIACIDEAYAIYSDRITDMPSVSDGVDQEITENRVWVAVKKDNIVGCVFLVFEDKYVKLVNLAVCPDHNGMGIGRKLMDFSERETIKLGYNEMRLNTHAAMPENIQFYAHLGWHETGSSGNTVQMIKFMKS